MSSEIKILFYIIGGIVYLIATYYGKEKKKQNERTIQKRPIPEQNAEEIFEELRKTLSFEKPPPKDKPAPISLKKSKPSKTPFLQVDYKEKKKKPLEQLQEHEPHMDHHFKNVEIAEMDTIVEQPMEFNPHETDLRKAFIYGEIFKRPQY
ncbi:MAG: hypothetical protein V4613_06205 [Bacteroidota bacterium]